MLPDLPLNTIASGATGNVPTMIGTTADEMTLFLALDLGVGEIDGGGATRAGKLATCSATGPTR